MSTTAAIRQKAHESLEKKQNVRNRVLLLMGVIIFTLGMLVGRLPSSQAQPLSTCDLSQVNAVFLEDPQQNLLERWAVIDSTGESSFQEEDGVVFLTITGNWDGPFFPNGAPTQ